MMVHLLAIAAGLLLDRLIGDPPSWPHPVRWIGALISKLTAKWNHGPNAFLNGFWMAGIVAASAFSGAYFLVFIGYSIHWLAGAAIEALLIAAGLAQKSLRDAAEEVYRPLIEKDLPAAREKLGWIVGRDTDKLDESEITRGVVETVSENTSDGVTAPLFWAFLFGAPGLWLYKAVNTCDSMVGYKNDEFHQFGYASARLDDVMNWIPSRITGLLILLATKNERSMTIRQRFVEWKRDAKKHPSPNSGWLEAATAVQLGIELGGVNTYKGIVSNRARMGTPIFPLEAHHIHAAVWHMNVATFWFFILFSLGRVWLELA
ncbi:adenosylcobinamide-phosphate synthase CbiB [Planomicrobium sp. CPCC 101110]|uniref:adenosylcobinamide-phosphate synthase CbiB n=1 Tax=Planomicrobium sp. CPCC 101110 TaxID=2599619 RepID=UPI0011B7B862|nr:adenosylcobinamide-phosphate synthase CbiB [Planomicrobium sp. CPCC 101110]TWT27616.1 cobalamin biosynthesis protein CobD [Planomicrobium sp. CPCC 101110]